jgi:hypothetical protein
MSSLNQEKAATTGRPSEVLAPITMSITFSRNVAKPLGSSSVAGQAWFGWLMAGYFLSALFGTQMLAGPS